MTEYILIYYDNDMKEHCKRFLKKSLMESFIKEIDNNTFYYNAYIAENINAKLNFN